jgi:class 3 adenylate cyclase
MDVESPIVDIEAPAAVLSIGEKTKNFIQSINVKILRLSLILCLLITTAVLSFSTHFLIKRLQRERFESEYKSIAARLSDGIRFGYEKNYYIAHSISSLFEYQYNDFPKVILPGFPSIAGKHLKLSRASRAISFTPLVFEENRLEWENFANRSYGLLDGDEGLVKVINNSWPVYKGMYDIENGIKVYAKNYDEDTRYPLIKFPVWQTSRGDERLTMFNMHSEATRAKALDRLVTFSFSAVTDLLVLIQDTNFHASTILFAPVLDLYYPGNGKESNIAGATALYLSWDSIFTRITPDFVVGIQIVLRSPTKTYSFIVNNGIATSQGKGDLHEDAFSSYAFTFPLCMPQNCDKTTNIYTVSIYPTQKYAEIYYDALPWIATGTVVGLMLFTFLVIFTYAYFAYFQRMELREVVSNTSRVLAPLFPKRILSKLRLLQKDERTRERASSLTICPFPMSVVPPLTDEDSEVIRIIPNIADYYPNTTVLFADLEGFTKWSSQHTPVQVFELLERVFTGLDVRAKKLGVFKVETIGDCYMAATGVPYAVDNHAEIMADFAMELVEWVDQVIADYEHTTILPLNIRVGIHSGALTGGCIAGDKVRFQLFGETVNLASRMESTCIAGRIQVSSATASMLQASGYDRGTLKIRASPNDANVPYSMDLGGGFTMGSFWLEEMYQQADGDTTLILDKFWTDVG